MKRKVFLPAIVASMFVMFLAATAADLHAKHYQLSE